MPDRGQRAYWELFLVCGLPAQLLSALLLYVGAVVLRGLFDVGESKR